MPALKMLRGCPELIRVRINIYFTLPERLGWRSREVVLEDNTTIADLLDKLPELKKAIREYEEKGFAPAIMINGRRIEFLGGYKARLKNGDEVDIFPPAAGG